MFFSSPISSVVRADFIGLHHHVLEVRSWMLSLEIDFFKLEGEFHLVDLFDSTCI